jgi:hypothetical protein
MANKTAAKSRKNIGQWVYFDSDEQKARFVIAAGRSPFKSASNFFLASTEKAVAEQERRLGPITSEMVQEHLRQKDNGHTNGHSRK